MPPASARPAAHARQQGQGQAHGQPGEQAKEPVPGRQCKQPGRQQRINSRGGKPGNSGTGRMPSTRPIIHERTGGPPNGTRVTH